MKQEIIDNYRNELIEIYTKYKISHPFDGIIEWDNERGHPVIKSLPDIDKKTFNFVYKMLIKSFEEDRRKNKYSRKQTQRECDGEGYNTDIEIAARKSLSILYQLKTYIHNQKQYN